MRNRVELIVSFQSMFGVTPKQTLISFSGWYRSQLPIRLLRRSDSIIISSEFSHAAMSLLQTRRANPVIPNKATGDSEATSTRGCRLIRSKLFSRFHSIEFDYVTRRDLMTSMVVYFERGNERYQLRAWRLETLSFCRFNIYHLLEIFELGQCLNWISLPAKALT